VLAGVSATLRGGPDVHRPITVAEKIQSPVPQHGVLAGALVVGGQLDRFLVAIGIAPDVLRGAALVPLGVTTLKRKPREVQRLSARIVRPVARLCERHDRPGAGRRINASELCVWKCRESARRVEDLARGRPTGN